MYIYVARIHMTVKYRWDQVPRNKSVLIAAYNKTVVQHPTIFHVSANYMCIY